jgi:hypothetical protein
MALAKIFFFVPVNLKGFISDFLFCAGLVALSGINHAPARFTAPFIFPSLHKNRTWRGVTPHSADFSSAVFKFFKLLNKIALRMIDIIYIIL